MPNNNSQQRFRVALWGVAHGTLLFGRACTLAEIPLVGVYDEDPQKALRAALFLGVSAVNSEAELWESNPTLVVAGTGFPENLPGSVELLLHLESGETREPRACRLTVSDLDSDLPTEISSRLPSLEVKTAGAAEARRRAREFLQALSPVFGLTVDP